MNSILRRISSLLIIFLLIISFDYILYNKEKKLLQETKSKTLNIYYYDQYKDPFNYEYDYYLYNSEILVNKVKDKIHYLNLGYYSFKKDLNDDYSFDISYNYLQNTNLNLLEDEIIITDYLYEKIFLTDIFYPNQKLYFNEKEFIIKENLETNYFNLEEIYYFNYSNNYNIIFGIKDLRNKPKNLYMRMFNDINIHNSYKIYDGEQIILGSNNLKEDEVLIPNNIFIQYDLKLNQTYYFKNIYDYDKNKYLKYNEINPYNFFQNGIKIKGTIESFDLILNTDKFNEIYDYYNQYLNFNYLGLFNTVENKKFILENNLKVMDLNYSLINEMNYKTKEIRIIYYIILIIGLFLFFRTKIYLETIFISILLYYFYINFLNNQIISYTTYYYLNYYVIITIFILYLFKFILNYLKKKKNA